MNVVCYERGLLWTWSVMNWSVMNVVCYERGLLWTWSVMNVVCFEWFVLSGLLWSGLFWTVTDLNTVLFYLDFHNQNNSDINITCNNFILMFNKILMLPLGLLPEKKLVPSTNLGWPKVCEHLSLKRMHCIKKSYQQTTHQFQPSTNFTETK